MTKNKTVKSVDRSITILEELQDVGGARVSELSERLGMAESSVHSHLTTLHDAGYVVKHGDIYDIGLKVLSLSRYAQHRNEVFRTAKPKVNELAFETGEIVSLFAEDHGIGYFVYGRKSIETTVPNTQSKTAELHAVAPGKAMLAHYPRKKVEEIISRRELAALTENTITEKDELFQELEEIQSRGYAFNDEEYIEDLRAVGVPVKGAHGQVVAALSVYGPKHRLSGNFYETELPDMLQACANDMYLEVKYGNVD